MAYEKVFDNPYPDGWEDLPNETTPITASALQEHTDAIENIEDYLEDNPIQEWAQSETKPEYYSTEIKIQSVANPNYTQQDFNDGISAELQSIPFEYVSNETFGELSDDVDSLKESLTHQANVGFLQKNLVSIESGEVSANLDGAPSTIRARSVQIVSTTPSSKYTMSCVALSGKTVQVAVKEVDASGNPTVSATWKSLPCTHTMNANTYKFRLMLRVSDDSANPQNYISNFQCEEGASATTYVPFALGNTELTKQMESATNEGFISRNLLPSEVNKIVPCKLRVGDVVTWSAKISSGSLTLKQYNANKTVADYWMLGLSSNPRTFTITADSEYIALTDNNANATNIMLNRGTEALPYETYAPSNTSLMESLANQGTWSTSSASEIGMYGDKKLYRKIFTKSATGDGTNVVAYSISTGIGSSAKIKHIYGIARRASDGLMYIIPYVQLAVSQFVSVFVDNSGWIQIRMKTSDTAEYNFEITVEYTE